MKHEYDAMKHVYMLLEIKANILLGFYIMVIFR